MGHWYRHTGEPLHTVLAKGTGQPRATTLRDARQLSLVPSVTTILDILGKPGLVKWQVDQGILAALTLGRKVGESDADFLKRLYADSRQQFINAGIMGDKIHTASEQIMSGRDVFDEEFLPHALAVKDLVTEHFPGVTDWVTETSFAHPLGFGGRIDLLSPATGIVIDFKGKDFSPDEKKVLAFEQHYQLGAYQIGMDLPVAEGMNIFISRTHPGYAHAHTWSKEKMQHGRDVFTATFNLWKVLKKYDPSFGNKGIVPQNQGISGGLPERIAGCIA